MKNVTITEMHLVLVCFTYSFAQHLLSVTKGQLIFQALVLIKVTSWESYKNLKPLEEISEII